MSSTGRTIGVALALPDPWRAALRDWRERLGDPDARQIPPHVTLLPPTTLPLQPGGSAVHEIDQVADHLETVAKEAAPFVLRLRGTGTFRPVSPVVFVQLVQGMAECALLERSVRSGPLARDVEFPYYPHVTVAHDLSGADLDRAEAQLASYDATIVLDTLTLFERDADGWWRVLRECAFQAGSVALPGTG